MTKDEFIAAPQPYHRRCPFRAFLIEFTSGSQLLISHPEALRDQGILYVMRSPDGGNFVFAAESVSRMLNVPSADAK
jgi:hypothetical protein